MEDSDDSPKKSPLTLRKSGTLSSSGEIEDTIVQNEEWQISVPHHRIEENERKKKSFVLYVIKIEIKGAMCSEWTVSRRYSEFRKLHSKVSHIISEHHGNFSLPSKHILSNKSLDPHFIEERRQKLENYLRHCCRIPELIGSEVFEQFVEKGLQFMHTETDPDVRKPTNEETTSPQIKYKTGSVKIKDFKPDAESELSKSPMEYLVIGMKLKTTCNYKAKTSEELSILKGDIVTYRGVQQPARNGKYMLIKVDLRGVVGFVREDMLEVLPSFMTANISDVEPKNSQTLRRRPFTPQVQRHSTLFNTNMSPVQVPVGLYRSRSENSTEYISTETRSKVRSTREFFDDYYRDLTNYLIQRQRRHDALLGRLNHCENPQQKDLLLAKFKAQESALLRRKRKKMSLDDFEVVDMIGRGGFGKVFLCRNKLNNEHVALKKIKKSVILERNKLESIRTEREVLKGTESPWLVKLICSFQDHRNLYFAMQYAPGGNLKTLLEDLVLPEKSARFYVAEMIQAVGSLHDLGFVHRDLKPDNFLFDKNGHIMLADFGLSKGGIVQKLIKGNTGNTVSQLRVYLADNTFRTVAVTSDNTAEDVVKLLCRKMGIQQPAEYGLFEVSNDGTIERKVTAFEKMNKIMSAWSPGTRFVFKLRDRLSLEEQSAHTADAPGRSRMNSLIRQQKRDRSLSIRNAQKEKAYSFVGSPHYMAPEIIMQEGYDEQVDWWSIGCILYEMVVGFPPFMGDSPQEVFGNILDHENMLQFPEDSDDCSLSPQCEDFIRQLLSPVSIRLGRKSGYKDLMQHPFLKEVKWAKLREETAPFVPQLNSPTDTTYFHMSAEEKQGSINSGEIFDEEEAVEADSEVPKAPKQAASPGAAFSLRNSLMADELTDEVNSVLMLESSPHSDSEKHPRGLNIEGASKVAKKNSHRRGKSYDFVGFTFKPNSWMNMGEIKFSDQLSVDDTNM
eukprot:TRINITY_DN4162_c0_g1_i1.p1 TRINITY_DN4162_c0_g1~~TRINITY_DN4162_c0_g1_i1.p1  ORF type:complete len:965 (-),score=203.61 TRINITY_DN4162_c0_g1_i1:17-2884(-)